jgi:oxygen-dependent protoporphyrinogen oxidase
MQRIVVIGAGLAGLTVAHRLAGRAELLVLEKATRLGGQLFTTEEHGFVVERGAEGFVHKSTHVPELCAELGLGQELIEQSVLSSFGLGPDGLARLAPGEAARFLGFQVAADDLGKGIKSLAHGRGSLVDALATRLGPAAACRTGPHAQAVEPEPNGKLSVVLEHGERLLAEGVVVATTAASAARLLVPLAGERARALAAAKTLSSVTVELAFAQGAIGHALDGTGFVVTLEEQREGLRACTFTSSKFAGRAPKGSLSVRVFARPTDQELEALSDADWVERALRGLARAVPVNSRPSATWVSRWPHALPVHDDAHRQRVTELEQAIAAYPVRLAGSAFHGAGIDAAVRSAHAAADALATSVLAPGSAAREAEKS